MDLTMKYIPREWDVYEVEIDGEYRLLRELLEKADLISCGSDSKLAQERFGHTGSIEGLFFFDVEQIFMNLDKSTYGVMNIGVLTEEWRDHPIGSLVLVVAKGAPEGKFTVGVEKS